MTPIIFYQFHYEVGDQYDLTNLWILNENINIIGSLLQKIDLSGFLTGATVEVDFRSRKIWLDW